jgi:hypothetical protein
MSQSPEHLAKVKALAHQLVDTVSAQETHLIALQALMSAYTSVAICHPCCARTAASTARHMADVIEAHAAPAGAPVH